VNIIFEDIIIPFLAIAIAELGDKTQLSVLLLSSRTKKYYHIFLGVFFAFLKPLSGIVFIIFGVYILLNKKAEKEEKTYDKNVFVAAFLIIFLTEWGDKTQVAAALFATQYNAVFVLLGTMLALSLLSLMAIFCGKILCERLNQNLLKKIAGIVFIVLGLTCFIF